MTSNLDVAGSRYRSPFFPSRGSSANMPQPPPTSLKDRVDEITGLDGSYLATASDDEMQHVLESLVGALKNIEPADLQLGDRHTDGGLRITSHLAVWLIGKVSDAYGDSLVRLSKIPSIDSLRSTHGLAQLLSTAISKKRASEAL